MGIVALLEYIGIVGSTAYWLKRQVLKHVDTCVHKQLGVVYDSVVEIKQEHKVLIDRINDLERILVDFVELYSSEHCYNGEIDKTVEQQ